MESIKKSGIKNVEYQFSRPIPAIDMYNSIREFNSVYPEVDVIINKHYIKKLGKEFMKTVKKLKTYKGNEKYYELKMYNFITMRINSILETDINVYTEQIDIKYEAYNNNVYAIGKKDSYTMFPKFKYEEKTKTLKKLRDLIVRKIKGMLS